MAGEESMAMFGPASHTHRRFSVDATCDEETPVSAAVPRKCGQASAGAAAILPCAASVGRRLRAPTRETRNERRFITGGAKAPPSKSLRAWLFQRRPLGERVQL